ncbi:DUF6600 domain-containing protein [Lunatimonas salinarum]|uniref:DUF6600 domain-containing protein n=1 Tax=Lunatimonas salinarum TaxID=1774590 RepID=UPI001ADF51D7|nr:DUF6600 domain-containing protein [Lunatimonas salinarum]
MKTSMNIRLSNTILGVCMAMVLLVFSVSQPAEAKINTIGVSFQVFYDGLAPYGDWVQDPTHGYIWIPYVEAGFQPYRTNGYWVNSRFGNTWVSLYDWGWAPFHYGRWFYTDFYGWAWVPGYEWGPAWVEWRTGRGYYGWAPMWPRVGVHVSVGFPVNYWVFVPRRRFLARNIYNYYIPPRNVAVIYNQTTIINNTYVYDNRTYIAGPSRSELQRVTRSRVPVYDVRDGRRPGRANLENNQITVYRPEVSPVSNRANAADARPSRAYTSSEFQERRRSTVPVPAMVENSRSSVHQRQASTAAVPSGRNPRLSSGNELGGESARSARATVTSPTTESRSAAPAYRPQATGSAEARQGSAEQRSNTSVPRVASQPRNAPLGNRIGDGSRASNEQRQQRVGQQMTPSNRQSTTVQPRQGERQQQLRAATRSTSRVATPPRTSQNRVASPPARTQQPNRVAPPSNRGSQNSRVSTSSAPRRQSSPPRVSSGGSSRGGSAAAPSSSGRTSTSQGRRGN